MEDPRVRGQEIFDEEDRQIWEIYTCPLADYWNRRDGGKLGSFYCEEYQYARLLAYTENVGQLNLSKELTCPRDNFCRFSLFFREANMSRERAKEAFAHCDPGYEAPKDPPADVSFGEGIRDMTISIYANILETAREICGRADRLEAGCLDNLRRGTYSVENGMIFLSLAGMMRQACGRLENIALLSAALGRYEWAGNPASTMRQTPTA